MIILSEKRKNLNSERKKIEEELLNEKKFTETALNALRDTFFVFNPSTSKAIRWNKAFSVISGYSNEEIANMKAPESYYSEKDLEKTVRAIKKINNEETVLLEMNLVTKDGKAIPFEYLATRINDDQGNLKYIVSIGRDITERKKTEQKLKESESRYRSLFENMTSAFAYHKIIVDENNKPIDYEFIEANPAFEEFTGLKVENIIGKTVTEVLPEIENDPADWIGKYGKVALEGTPITFDNYSEPLDQWYFVSAYSPKKDYFAVTFTNISAHKLTEQKLKESEKRFKDERDNLINMLNSMEDGVYIINQHYEIEYVNPSLKNTFGPIENKKCYEYFQKLSEPCPWCKTQEKATKGSIRWEWDSPITNKFYEIIATPIKRPDGNFSKLVIFHDINKRKKAAIKIKKAREQADMYLNLAGVILVALNRDGIITLINNKGYEILEYEEGELDGQNWFEKCLHKKIKDEVFEIFIGLMSGDLKSFEYTEGDVLTKNGKRKTIAWHNIILYDKNGNINGTLSSGEDITEHKKAEQELKRLSKLKSELLTRTSHELKTPAMHIKGYADLLLHKYKNNLGIEELQIISHIKKGCLRLETLIYDIMHKAELDSGLGELNKAKNDLSSLIELSVRELKSFAALRGHSIILDIHDSMIINFDKEQIRHVINNIMTNAIKYTPLNGIIGINSTIEDDYITITIQDNGIGFTEEQINRLFTQFGKIERYGQGFDIITEGSGLGLHIAKKIIELHGGKIWIESGGRNKGSTFYFSLPKVNI